MRLIGRHEIEVTALYVEDEETTRFVLASMIRAQFPKLRLITAENGKAGLEAYNNSRADIVITDISMPQMSGLEMARHIKNENQEVNIIVLTALDNIKYLLECIDLGVKQYVIKPVEHQVLFAAIEKCIDSIYLNRLLNEQNAFIRKLSRAVERSPSMVMITDVNGTIEYVNPKFCEVTGYTPTEVVGENPRILKTGQTPPGVYKELWETLLSGKEWHGVFSNRKKNGESYWEQASISPIPNEEKVITHFVALKEDITERRNAENEIANLNAALKARAAELEAANQELETFNYSVSHDLRTPLTVINGCCQVVMEMAGEKLDENCREYLSVILERVANMNGLIKSLLNFSRINRCDMSLDVVDLSQLASEIIYNLRFADKTDRDVECRINSGIDAIGDAYLLRGVLDNLLGNAWKYTSLQDKALIEFGVMKQEGKQVYFVRDTGVGFDQSKADKLFIPFQRLHKSEEFAGNGIGLATVKRIIQRHGGDIWAEGEVGKGATFFFTLNKAENQLASN